MQTKLRIQTRIALISIFPERGDIIDLRLKSDLERKLGFSPKEMAKFQIRFEQNRLFFNKLGVMYERQYNFSDAEITYMRKAIQTKQDRKELDDRTVPIYAWLVEGKEITYEAPKIQEPEELQSWVPTKEEWLAMSEEDRKIFASSDISDEDRKKLEEFKVTTE